MARFRLQNFKAFGDTPSSLRLRPLTLVFGRNNAGKSALIRLPSLLAGAMQHDAPPGLPLDHDGVAFGRRLEDFVHGHVAGRCTLGMDLLLDGAPVSVEGDVGPAPLTGVPAVHGLRVRAGDDELTWSLSGAPSTARFAGLLPTFPTMTEWVARRPELGAWLPALVYTLRDTARGLVDRVGPIREPLSFSWDLGAQAPLRVGPTGADAAQLLAWDRLRGDGRLVAEVAHWLERITGSSIAVSDFGGGAARADGFSLLASRGRARVLNAALAGTGVQQVLPVIVQLATARLGRSTAGLIVAEEPEAHLHPAAQAELADLMLAAAANEPGPPLLIETHSDTLLLRVQRRVAEGALHGAALEDRIGIYFVDDFEDPPVLRELHLDDEGLFDDWPQGIFDEDAAERRALHRARAARATP